MPFHCTCNGLNFSKYFGENADPDKRLTSEDVDQALTTVFNDHGRNMPDTPEAVKDALLEDAAHMYGHVYQKLFGVEPGCTFTCTDAVLHLIEHSGMAQIPLNELRNLPPSQEVKKAAVDRRDGVGTWQP